MAGRVTRHDASLLLTRFPCELSLSHKIDNGTIKNDLTMENLTAEDFKQVANQVLRNNPNRNESELLKDYISFFGSCPATCAELWNRLQPVQNIHRHALPKYLLWAMVFLKKYSDEKTHCKIVGIKDPKTFRRWSWLFVEAIASLEQQVIRFERRFVNWNQTNPCLLSIDGTDCPIN